MPGRTESWLTVLLMAVFSVSRLTLASPGAGSGRMYDEGVYLLSARAMLAGERLFTEVFSSQPPAFLESLALTMRAAGDSLIVGRAFSLFWALALMAAVAGLARRLAGPVAAPLAVGALIAGQTFVDLARTLQAETPSLALAVAAILLTLRARERGWSPRSTVLAGAMFGAALLFKLFVAPLAVPLALLLLLGPPDGQSGVWSPDLRGAPVRAARFAVGTLAVLLLPVLLYPPLPVYEQTIAFHVAKFHSYHATPNGNLRKLASMMAADPVVTAAAAAGLAVLAVRNRLAALWLALWLATMALVVRGQTPLFWRHLVLVVPPLTAAAAAAFAWPLQRANAAGRLAGVAAAIALMWLPSLRQAHGGHGFLAGLIHAAAPRSRAGNGGPVSGDPLVKTVEWIRANTAPGEFVVGDDPIVIYLAGRRAPGELCDTSQARIHAGSLTLPLATRHTLRSRVVVLRAEGRLSRLKGYLRWMAQHYDRQASLDTGVPPERSVWIRKEPPASQR